MLYVTCFGEILWDVFPDHKKIGGAPLNVALRIQSFGIQTSIISRIGDDEEGRLIIEYMNDHDIDLAAVQIDKNYKTGCVNVTLDEKGSASYEIEVPAAWDKIEITKIAIENIKLSNAFIFGSLACRDIVSKSTLLKLLEYANFKVFDVNLRPPYYSIDLIFELMRKADFIKCNDEELSEICNGLGNHTNLIEEQIKFLSQLTNTPQICVTKGKDGAILYYHEQFYTNSGYTVKVSDTVGAGDSFLAALMTKFLNGSKPKDALSYACAVGALVAKSKGANPKLVEDEILNLIRPNKV